MTLDGSVEMLEGADWFDPQAEDEELIAEMRRQGETADALRCRVGRHSSPLPVADSSLRDRLGTRGIALGVDKDLRVHLGVAQGVERGVDPG